MEWAYEKVEEVEKVIIYNSFIFCHERKQRNFWVLLWRGHSKEDLDTRVGFFRVKKNATCLYVDRNDHVEKEKIMVMIEWITVERLLVDPVLAVLKELTYLLSGTYTQMENIYT